MKATVDMDTCSACGLCVDVCPDVFQLDEADDTLKVLVETVPEDQEDSCKEAQESCPCEAIEIE